MTTIGHVILSAAKNLSRAPNQILSAAKNDMAGEVQQSNQKNEEELMNGRCHDRYARPG
jgi:hypothetical protein